MSSRCRRIPIILVFVASMGSLIGCNAFSALGFAIPTPTLSAAQGYAQSLSGLLPQFEDWLEGPLQDYHALAATPVPGAGLTHSDALGLLILATESSGFPPLELRNQSPEVDGMIDAAYAFVPVLEEIRDGGLDLRHSFSALEPPPTVRLAHDDLMACIENRTEFADSLLRYLNNGIVPDLHPDECEDARRPLGELLRFMGETLE